MTTARSFTPPPPFPHSTKLSSSKNISTTLTLSSVNSSSPAAKSVRRGFSGTSVLQGLSIVLSCVFYSCRSFAGVPSHYLFLLLGRVCVLPRFLAPSSSSSSDQSCLERHLRLLPSMRGPRGRSYLLATNCTLPTRLSLSASRV